MALCLIATTGRAQDDKYRFILTGAYSNLSDARTFSEGYLPFGSAYARGGKVIVGLEVPWNKIIGLEGTIGYGQNNLEVTNFNNNPTTSISYSMRAMRASGDIIVRDPNSWKGVRPYLALGIEYDDFDPTPHAETVAGAEGFAFASTAKLAADGKPGVNIGGGLDYKLSKKLDLRLDVREHVFSSPTYNLPFNTPSSFGIAYFPVSGSAHDLEYTIGFVYRFSL